MKRLVSILIVSLMGVLAFSGCAGGDYDTLPSLESSSAPTDTYVFIAKDIQNTYMQKVYEGFETACREVGSLALYEAPEAPTAEKQIEIIERLTEQNVAGIAIAANDADALEEALSEAINSGIKIISVDSAVNSSSRQTHIQQADPEKIGRSLINAAYEIAGGSGGIGILSSTEQATNQNIWINYMNMEISENPEKYASTPIVEIAYGDDDFTKSVSETQKLLHNPDIKVIVAPTSVGIEAAAYVLQESESDVKLTGLGMPSQMAQYIEAGICPRMYLWNPVDVGYLAGYTINSLVNGSITGAEGETFTAGTLGERTITAEPEQGTEVVLGDLLEFNADNIAEWKDVY